MGLDVNTVVEGSATVVMAKGDIDLATAAEFRDEVLSAIGIEPMRLVLDLGNVGFIDSTGIGVIVLVRRKIRARRGRLDVVASRRVRAALKLSNLDQALTLHDSIEAALETDESFRDDPA